MNRKKLAATLLLLFLSAFIVDSLKTHVSPESYSILGSLVLIPFVLLMYIFGLNSILSIQFRIVEFREENLTPNSIYEAILYVILSTIVSFMLITGLETALPHMNKSLLVIIQVEGLIAIMLLNYLAMPSLKRIFEYFDDGTS